MRKLDVTALILVIVGALDRADGWVGARFAASTGRSREGQLARA